MIRPPSHSPHGQPESCLTRPLQPFHFHSLRKIMKGNAKAVALEAKTVTVTGQVIDYKG